MSEFTYQYVVKKSNTANIQTFVSQPSLHNVRETAPDSNNPWRRVLIKLSDQVFIKYLSNQLNLIRLPLFDIKRTEGDKTCDFYITNA